MAAEITGIKCYNTSYTSYQITVEQKHKYAILRWECWLKADDYYKENDAELEYDVDYYKIKPSCKARLIRAVKAYGNRYKLDLPKTN